MALGVLVICIVDKNCSPKKYFWPQVSKFFGSKFDIFGFGSPAGKFFTNEVSYWFPDMGVPKVVLLSKKKIGYLARLLDLDSDPLSPQYEDLFGLISLFFNPQTPIRII